MLKYVEGGVAVGFWRFGYRFVSPVCCFICPVCRVAAVGEFCPCRPGRLLFDFGGA